MDELVCKVCLDHYDKDYKLPIVLKCGDTICSSCVKSTFDCPKCDGSLTSQNSDDYIVNFAIMRIIDSLKEGTAGSAFLQHCIVTLKKKYADIESKFKKNSEKLKSDLEDILLSINELNEEEETSQTILTIHKQLDEIRNSSNFGLQNSRISESINLCDFKNPVTFLCEIYNRAADGELIYATTKVKEVVKFSRISVWSSKLILHAFDSLQNDCPSRTICKFQEIKKCLTDKNCCAFLEVCSNERGKRHCLLIQTTNSSLVPQFLKFCTGEKGPVYKGASFQKGVDEETKFVVKDSLKEEKTIETNKICKPTFTNENSQQSKTSSIFGGCSQFTPVSSQPLTSLSTFGSQVYKGASFQKGVDEETKFVVKDSLKELKTIETKKICKPTFTNENSQQSKTSSIFGGCSQFTPVSSHTSLSTFGSQLSTSSSCEHKTVTTTSLDEVKPFPSISTTGSQPSSPANIFGNVKFNFDPPKLVHNFTEVSSAKTTKCVIEVKKFMLGGIEDEGNYEYVSSLGTISTYRLHEAFVTGSKNGSFQIFLAARDGYAFNIIGTIQEPCEFLENIITYGDYSKITDSGIAIEIP